MWTAIAILYANDPAILYDSWNEGHLLVRTNPQQWQTNQNLLIQTIRARNPRSLVVVYLDQTDINANLHYRESNLVNDFLVYPSSSLEQNWPNNIDRLVEYAHQDGHAVLIGVVSKPGSPHSLPATQHVTHSITTR